MPDTNTIGWPRVHISLRSALRADQLLDRLRSATGPERTTFRLLLRAETTMLVGHVSPPGFSIRRAIQGRNSFAPQVVGTVVDEAGGSRLEAVMGIHKVVFGFLIAWICATTPLAMIALREWLTQGPSMQVAIPLILWSAIYPMYLLGFVPEARRMLRILRAIADAQGGMLHASDTPTLIR